ncbi:type II toxin-antitoxin system VapC family toxin [Actinophytocola sp.]|uniref:type II toxin-antitoxin system VapC family toxin n=1 Tax=Actinophytocola sp. TaxID=1872138 RepID=UPI003D6AE5B9
MSVLLDTRTWLWMQVSPEHLNEKALALVRDGSVDLFLSAASSWEMSIKYALGKLSLPVPPADYVPDRMRTSGVTGIPVTHRHALRVAQLPAHHRDPFDRVLIAQAQLDKLTILTADRMFDRYDVPVQWAD